MAGPGRPAGRRRLGTPPGHEGTHGDRRGRREVRQRPAARPVVGSQEGARSIACGVAIPECELRNGAAASGRHSDREDAGQREHEAVFYRADIMSKVQEFEDRLRSLLRDFGMELDGSLKYKVRGSELESNPTGHYIRLTTRATVTIQARVEDCGPWLFNPNGLY